MEILVAGGARYIGSYMVNALRQADCKVVVLDDLSAGHFDAAFWAAPARALSRRLRMVLGERPVLALL